MEETKKYFYVITSKTGVKMLIDNPKNLDSEKVAKAGTLLVGKIPFTIFYDPNWIENEMFVIAGSKLIRLQIIN